MAFERIGQQGSALGILGQRLSPDNSTKSFNSRTSQGRPDLQGFIGLQSPPDEGPESIEKNTQNLQEYTDDVLEGLMVSLNGMDDSDTTILRDLIRNTRAILKQRDYASRLTVVREETPTKQIARMKSYDEAISFMADHDIPYESLDADELFVMLKLAEAIYFSHKYANSFDTKARADGDHLYLESHRDGVQANRHFVDFFIKLDERFGHLTPDQLRTLYVNIFANYDLDKMFRGNDLGGFPAGIYGGLQSYLHLKENGWGAPPNRIKVSSIDQDLTQGIDLVEVNGDGKVITVFDVKSISTTNTNLHEVVVLDVNVQAHIDLYERFISALNISASEKSKRLKDTRYFEEVSMEMRADNPNLQAMKVLVPVPPWNLLKKGKK